MRFVVSGVLIGLLAYLVWGAQKRNQIAPPSESLSRGVGAVMKPPPSLFLPHENEPVLSGVVLRPPPKGPSLITNKPDNKITLEGSDPVGALLQYFDVHRENSPEVVHYKLRAYGQLYQKLFNDPHRITTVRSLAVQELMNQVELTENRSLRAPASDVDSLDETTDLTISSYNLFLQTEPNKADVLSITHRALSLNKDPVVYALVLKSFLSVYPEYASLVKPAATQ